MVETMNTVQEIESYLEESELSNLQDKVKKILELVLYQEQEVVELRTALLRNASDTYIIQQELKNHKRL